MTGNREKKKPPNQNQDCLHFLFFEEHDVYNTN